jgi:AraC family cel operon transcriptional repressor
MATIAQKEDNSAVMNDITRQKTDGWLDPVVQSRITCNEITWVNGKEFRSIQAGGDLYFHQVPRCGTLPHCHDFAEIILINTGGVVHKVNSDCQKLVAGSLVFMRPDDVHAFLPDESFAKVEIVVLDFDLDLFLSLSIYLENDAFLQQLTAPVLPPMFKLDPTSAGSLYTRLLKLNSPAISPVLRKIKIKILLGELFARFFIDEINLLSESQVPDWLENLCTVMRQEENFTGGIERMQKLAYCTPGHLCKCFQKYLRRTPTDFINELRLNQAARLLADSQKQILEIAEELRFESLSWFYNIFKKYYGLSPAAYRKLHAGKRTV